MIPARRQGERRPPTAQVFLAHHPPPSWCKRSALCRTLEMVLESSNVLASNVDEMPSETAHVLFRLSLPLLLASTPLGPI